MDSKQLGSEELERLYKEKLASFDVLEHGKEVRTAAPEMEIIDHVGGIFRQRKEQREKVLTFVMELTFVITRFFISLVVLNVAASSFFGRNIISDNVLSIIAVSFFAEVIAVMHSITKELWHEDGILSAPVVQSLIDRNKSVK